MKPTPQSGHRKNSIMEIAKKITLGGINGVRKGFKGITETLFVGRIMGIASSVEEGETPMGPYVKFKGDFEGTNMEGEITRAPVCYLIAPADGMLAAAIKASDNKPVSFGFDFYAVPMADAVLGCAYKVKPLLETAASDPMLALQAAIGAPVPLKSKQLALPATAPEVAPVVAPEVAHVEPAAKEAHKNGKKG